MRKVSSGKSNNTREASPIDRNHEVPTKNIDEIQLSNSVTEGYNDYNAGRNSEVRDGSRGQKYFRSFDVISGKNKLYGL